MRIFLPLLAFIGLVGFKVTYLDLPTKTNLEDKNENQRRLGLCDTPADRARNKDKCKPTSTVSVPVEAETATETFDLNDENTAPKGYIHAGYHDKKFPDSSNPNKAMREKRFPHQKAWQQEGRYRIGNDYFRAQEQRQRQRQPYGLASASAGLRSNQYQLRQHGKLVPRNPPRQKRFRWPVALRRNNRNRNRNRNRNNRNRNQGRNGQQGRTGRAPRMKFGRKKVRHIEDKPYEGNANYGRSEYGFQDIYAFEKETKNYAGNGNHMLDKTARMENGRVVGGPP